MPLRFSFVLFLLVSLIGTAAVSAQNAPRQIGVYRTWEAYVYKENGNQICFIQSDPVDSAPDNVRRGEIYVVVTHRPAKGVRDEVAIYVGYPFREKSEALVEVGSAEFRMFTSGQNAWAYNTGDDKKIVQAMVRGADMIVKGTSQRGTDTTDKYSLLGFTAARNAINKACPAP